MKSKLLVVISMIAVLVLSACSNTEGEAASEQLSLEQQAQILIDEVIMLAASEDYLNLVTGQGEIRNIIDDIAAQDYSSALSTYQLDGVNELIMEFMLAEGSLDPQIEEIVGTRMAGVLPGQINAMNGTETLAATSILSHSNSFIFEGLDKPTIYLYTFDHDYSFMVQFTPNQQNIVNANINIIANAELKDLLTTEDLMEYFMAMTGWLESETTITVEEL